MSPLNLKLDFEDGAQDFAEEEWFAWKTIDQTLNDAKCQTYNWLIKNLADISSGKYGKQFLERHQKTIAQIQDDFDDEFDFQYGDDSDKKLDDELKQVLPSAFARTGYEQHALILDTIAAHITTGARVIAEGEQKTVEAVTRVGVIAIAVAIVATMYSVLSKAA